ENSQLQYRILHVEMENIQKKNQVSFNPKMLAKLSGKYGPKLKIIVDGENIQIDGVGPIGARNLKIINDNTFIDGPVIIKFERDKNHNPVSLTCYFQNGGKEVLSV